MDTAQPILLRLAPVAALRKLQRSTLTGPIVGYGPFT